MLSDMKWFLLFTGYPYKHTYTKIHKNKQYNQINIDVFCEFNKKLCNPGADLNIFTLSDH